MKQKSKTLLAIALTGWLTTTAWSAPTAEEELDFAGLEEAVDALFEGKMDEHQVSGGVVAIVYRGETLLSKGYGLANVESGRPVQADRTLFRLGSISKTLTAAAVLSLVEDGKLSLDGDLRKSLGVEFPTRFDAPVTLRQLLTHSAGLELTDIGDAARTVEAVVPLREMVAHHMTAQSWAPGSLFAYSNHGLTLAGYAVEEADGRPFAEAVAARVFAPLGMARSSFAQPLPAELAGDLAQGHEATDGGFRVLPLDYSNVVPADTLMSTADDMARFMRALLGGGALEGVSVLSPASVQAMTQPQFSYVESQPIAGLGLFFERYRGRWALAHTGGQLGFTSHMVLFPQQELGIFLALNTRTGRMRWEVLQELLERYLPEAEGEVGPAPRESVSPADLERYAGTYRRMDYPRHTIEKTIALAGFVPESTVSVFEDGTLRIGDTELFPIGEQRFWSEEWQSEYRFEADKDGQIVRAYGRRAWERVPWWSHARLHRILWGVAMVVFLSYLIAAAVHRFKVRRHRNRAKPLDSGWPARTMVALALVYTLSMIGFVVVFFTSPGDLDYGIPWYLQLVLLGINAGALLTLVALPATYVVLHRPDQGWLAKTHLAAVTAAAVILTASLAMWSLVG